MKTPKILASALEFVRRFELSMDYDPSEAQGRRLAILERNFGELSERIAARERSIEAAKLSIAAE